MTPKTILVCLTTIEHAETLMKVTVPLARRYNAHLIGLHTIEAIVVYPGVAIHVPDHVFDAYREGQEKNSAAVKKIFEKHVKSEDFASEFRLVRAQSISANDRMVESARAADLVVMSQEDREHDRNDQRGAPVDTIRLGGRPVIVVPIGYDGPEVGSNILLGWSDTREAARAAHDMLSVAKDGAKVSVLRVSHAPRDVMKDHDGIDIVETLSRHGLDVTLDHREAGHRSIAQMLELAAFEAGADLIVTGAFGHSVVYDFVMGATTYALLKDMKRPVLFAK